MPEFEVYGRKVGPNHPPLVIAEIGINHEGDFGKAIRMVDDAIEVGCECVKFQSHIIEDEMIPNQVVPANAEESIWDIMERCALTEEEEVKLKNYVESKGVMFLSTPFSRAAADRLISMDVQWFKIGSGECNNYPLVAHIASFGKPVIVSTGMNNIESIAKTVDILRGAGIPFALNNCTSMYPTPYKSVRLGGLRALAAHFDDAVIGQSDHSLGNYTCYGAVALGASLVEKHFTSDKSWPGPDVPISITPDELKELIDGTYAVWLARGGTRDVLPEERPTIDFAYACVVSVRDIVAGERLTRENIWVKRPGTGEILSVDYENLLGRVAQTPIAKDTQLSWKYLA